MDVLSNGQKFPKEPSLPTATKSLGGGEADKVTAFERSISAFPPALPVSQVWRRPLSLRGQPNLHQMNRTARSRCGQYDNSIIIIIFFFLNRKQRNRRQSAHRPISIG
ncbi:MAG: hypothetical protein JWP25_6769 [Bradyrhizobium sp.]|nr:hypothetical protein [Bradyrhizobium sp.]